MLLSIQQIALMVSWHVASTVQNARYNHLYSPLLDVIFTFK